MHISDCFGLPHGHGRFNFVDTTSAKDTELFIDPCLIEVGTTPFCQTAIITMSDYFDSFYGLYRSHAPYDKKIDLFQYAHEINATKLGYGNGNNGKAKTAEGMVVTFSPLQKLVDASIPLSKAIDLPIFIRDFAEDCLSDMLTNILFKDLSQYTIEQCNKYSYPLKEIPHSYHYWDVSSHSWQVYNGVGMFIGDKLILLVPKNIVRHSYYYNVDQFFRSVILEKIQKEQTSYDNKGREIRPSKSYLRDSLLKTHSDILEISKEKTTEDPNLLNVLHNKMPLSYSKRGLSDEELDYWTYE